MRVAARALIVLFVIAVGAGARPGLAQTANGPSLAVQADGLLLFRGTDRSAAFSPFLAFELRVVSSLSLRLGLSPPLGNDTGQQAFATNLAINVWFGKGPDFIETAIGTYYRNTWCNGSPDYKAYTLYLGLRHASRSSVFRLGGILGVTPGGQLAIGVGIGFGRAIGSHFLR